MKKYFSSALLILLFVALLTACKKEDNGEPPALPPVTSLDIDFENFIDETKSDDLNYLKGTENSNWQFAAGVALIWRTVIYTTLAVPVRSFQIAVNKTPTYLDNKTWQWKYDATLSIDNISVTYKARLTGQIRTDDVLWKMYIAKEGTNSFDEFVWFEGTSRLDGTGGQWILNESAANQVPVLQIDWTGTQGTVTTVQYTYVKVGEAFKDSYIKYGLTTGTYNAFYEISYFNGVLFSPVNVEWNTTSKIGHVKAPSHFPTSDWYCWDEGKNNMVCLP